MRVLLTDIILGLFSGLDSKCGERLPPCCSTCRVEKSGGWCRLRGGRNDMSSKLDAPKLCQTSFVALLQSRV